MFGTGLNSIMASAATSPYSGYSSNIANQAMAGLLGSSNQLGMSQSQMQALQAQQYNQVYNRPKPKWVFDGKTCSVREMADEIWHQDCPEKTHFILKYE